MAKTIASSKLTDAEKVTLHMQELNHPLKKEMEAVRKIIRGSNASLSERIKWNAPSYYYLQDIVTFGPLKPDKVLLVFHYPLIVNIQSSLLEGNYKDRRLVSFGNMQSIKAGKQELEKIINGIIEMIDSKSTC